jgi:hypothetical protein
VIDVILKYLLMSALGALLVPGCLPFGSDGCFCTKEYVAVGFSLVDQAGQPVPDVPVRVVIVRTGKSLGLEQPGAAQGFYIVITDSQKELLDPSGERIRVTGSVGDRSFRVEFVVSVPGECHCHIRKISGPSEVVLD